ncbi:MAG: tetratricopeptide repeat protein, partial [Balneolaceae bacterium]
MKFKSITVFIAIIAISLAFLPVLSFSQSGNYQIANRLLQQQKYNEAKPLFKQLHEGNPEAFIFFDRYVETLINTKDFDEALKVTKKQIETGNSVVQTSIRLGEIYHIMGERDKSIEIWLSLIVQNPNSIQIYYNVGSAMISRREYETAIDLYKNARSLAGNDQLFTNEIANALMQSGLYSEAMREYFTLITNSPDQMAFVQQRLLRMRDKELYRSASVDLEDYLLELDINHSAYSQLHQLLTWMLLETEQYRRALVVARQYEARSSGFNYSLYSVASQLNSVRQFELAAEGYQYYIDNGTSSIRFRSMQQLADVYYNWADFTQDYSIDTYRKRIELFKKAYEINSKLIAEAPRYDRMGDVIISQIDLALDVFYDTDDAEKWIDKLVSLNDPNLDAHELYARGKLSLFK